MFVIREYKPEDAAFVISSYLKSQRYIHPNQEMRDTIYYQTFKPIAEDMVKNSKILLATNPEDEWQIFGWLSYDQKPIVLNYIYVKHPYRGAKIATQLYKQVNPANVPMIATHSGLYIEGLKKKFNLYFVPKIHAETQE